MNRSLTAIIFSLAIFGAGVSAAADSAGTQVASLNDMALAAPVQEASDCSAHDKVASGAVASCADIAGQVTIATVPQACMPSISRQSGQSNNLFTLSAIDNGDCMNAGVKVAGGQLFPDVPIVMNKNVESFISYFQTRGRKHFERWMGRSKDYMAMLQSILAERGLPEEISYIALIESGLNPTAKSHANAVGMWQFIKGTGVRYGLRVDWWIDERMDPEKATVAASKYFSKLYGQFGSWYLAAAGYNAGEGKVVKAVKKHGTDDFWELASHKKSFRRETKEYVPKYLAALMISKDPKSYGFDEQDMTNGLVYEKVAVSQPTDLRIIADAAGTTVDEIKRLNPELLRRFTPPNYPNYLIKIPVGASGIYAENMSRVPASKKISFLMHKVKRGETVAKIASKYGTSKEPIMYLNNINTTKRLKAGIIIAVPLRSGSVTARNGKDVTEVLAHLEFQS